MTETSELTTNVDSPSWPQDPNKPPEPLERLEERICELAGHLAAATCRFLQLVVEFDERGGWASWDLPSCAAWLAWKCQVAPGTAREQVRVARALTALPVITGEFAAGRMSYAKARALTRIATTATEAGLAEITSAMTASQCERFVAAHRTCSDDLELASRAARQLRVHVAEDGQVTITARLPAADGTVVLQALRAAAGDCEHPHRPHRDAAENTGPAEVAAPIEDAGPAAGTGPGADGVSVGTSAGAAAPGDGAGGHPDDGAARDAGSCRASLADALVEVAEAYLSGKIATAGNADIYQVIVHVGPEALTSSPAAADRAADSPAAPGVSAETPGDQPAGTAAPGDRPAGHPAHPRRCHLDDGPALSPAAAQAIACHATITWMLHDHAGNLLDAGRRHRTPPPALRRAVRERDHSRCQYPGCRSRRTDIHHITPWANGGKTRLRDLILLCEAHHVIVHALGYHITLVPGGGFAFTRPDGQPMPNAPDLPGSDGDLARCHAADITTETIIPTGLADKFDLELAVWAALANARIAAERAAAGTEEHDLAA